MFRKRLRIREVLLKNEGFKGYNIKNFIIRYGKVKC